jgi:hypothetical protein
MKVRYIWQEGVMMNMDVSSIRFLSSLSRGDTGEIVQVSGKPETHRYLCNQGLTIGRTISVDNTDADAHFTIQSGNVISVIGNELARNIKVRIS